MRACAGTGSAVVAEELSSGLLDFGYQFVGRTFSKDVTVYNMGRKPVMLTWTSNRCVQLRLSRAVAAPGSAQRTSGAAGARARGAEGGVAARGRAGQAEGRTSWSRRVEELKKEHAKVNRGAGKKFDIASVPAEQLPVFSITPDKVGAPPCPGPASCRAAAALRPADPPS